MKTQVKRIGNAAKPKAERYFSPESRERIAVAQRKRWRAWRKAQKAA